MAKIITLTTDFGLVDEYVGVMKGVILSKSPEVRLVDLTHAIPPYATTMAAYLIYAAYPFFGPGTVHVIVVDPGVGSSRDIIALQADEQIFVAPDNGLLTMFLENIADITVHKVTNHEIFLKPLSQTFHGRDIFAPVAAHLANGAPLHSVGPKTSISKLCRINLPKISIDPKKCRIEGTVIHIDHFGNATTNIHRNSLAEISKAPVAPTFELTVKQHTIKTISQTYQDSNQGEPLILFNSRNLLEIALNSGHAAKQLQISLNDSVTLDKI